jgi:hypothetical protein
MAEGSAGGSRLPAGAIAVPAAPRRELGEIADLRALRR